MALWCLFGVCVCVWLSDAKNNHVNKEYLGLRDGTIVARMIYFSWTFITFTADLSNNLSLLDFPADHKVHGAELSPHPASDGLASGSGMRWRSKEMTRHLGVALPGSALFYMRAGIQPDLTDSACMYWSEETKKKTPHLHYLSARSSESSHVRAHHNRRKRGWIHWTL